MSITAKFVFVFAILFITSASSFAHNNVSKISHRLMKGSETKDSIEMESTPVAKFFWFRRHYFRRRRRFHHRRRRTQKAPTKQNPTGKIHERCRSVENSQFRSFSGQCNNLKHPDQGAANTPFLLLSGFLRHSTGRSRLPDARYLSNNLCNEEETIPNKRRMSELVTFFGQFMDHTITETATTKEKDRSWIIPVSHRDPFFKRDISFFRTIRRGSGASRSPENKLSSYIDASSVYGVSTKEARHLRELRHGRLKLPGNLLPKNEKGEFEAGDKRVNENSVLIAMHLLWAREHNRIADEVSKAYYDYNDEQIYQLARHIVAAELQAVTYYSFIPALTGRLLPAYHGYKNDVKAVISNRFSSAAFRVGHTMLNSLVTTVDHHGKSHKVKLNDIFFKPTQFPRLGMDNIMRGIMQEPAAEIDIGITSAVRNFLMTSSKPETFDLAALNIQRGRDHGVPACNALRKSMGLKPFDSFYQMTKDRLMAETLRFAYYDRIDDVDAWICGVVEDQLEKSSLGPLFDVIIREEFKRLRDGDRFYFEKKGYFTQDQIEKLRSVQLLASGKAEKLKGILRTIIVHNTDLYYDEVPADPFFIEK